MAERNDLGDFGPGTGMNPFDYIENVASQLDFFCSKIYSRSNTIQSPHGTETMGYSKSIHFKWEYCQTWELMLRIPREEYQETTKSRSISGFKSLAETDSRVIAELARDLQMRALTEAYGRCDLACFVLSFVQYIPYSMAGNHPKHPIETLWEREGNCIDCSILAASILSLLNFDVAILTLREENHAMLGICGPFRGTSVGYGKKEYFFAETTRKGAKIGETARDTSRTEVTPVSRK